MHHDDYSQLHALGVMGVTRWRTGRLTLRDSFSYLPDGNFSIGAFGGVPGLGIATGSRRFGPGGRRSAGQPLFWKRQISVPWD